MANAWKTNNITFEPPSVLELGVSHDVLETANATQEQDKASPRKKKEIKKSLPPWMAPPDDKTLNWEHKREQKLINLRNSPTYSFIMLVTSFTNENMDKYWISPSETQAEHTKGVGKVTTQCNLQTVKNRQENNQRFHKFYIDTPWLNSIVYLSPAIYGHLEEAYVAVTQTHPHLEEAKLSLFTNTPKIRTMFAKLVALGIRMSDFLSQKRYNLDSTYRRIHMERRKLIHYWSHVRHVDGTLMYFHQNGRAAYQVPQNPFQVSENVDMDGLFKLSMELASNKNKYSR